MHLMAAKNEIFCFDRICLGSLLCLYPNGILEKGQVDLLLEGDGTACFFEALNGRLDVDRIRNE